MSTGGVPFDVYFPCGSSVQGHGQRNCSIPADNANEVCVTMMKKLLSVFISVILMTGFVIGCAAGTDDLSAAGKRIRAG